MVFYFTGNSLYIAKQIESEPVSIPQVMVVLQSWQRNIVRHVESMSIISM